VALEGHFVSALLDRLAAQLRRYDDDAFVALGNRGLLRRAQKDLEKTAASIVEDTGAVVTLQVGEHRISFDARGPAHARCSCGAGAVCHHILAAAISLPRLISQVPDATSLEALERALLAISASNLVKHAGKAGYRWAWQFVQDLEPERALHVGGTNHLVLSFHSPRVSFRYMGGNLDDLIADSDFSQIEKYRAAVVLAFQRAHGAELTPPEPAGKSRTAALDLGKDHAGIDPTGKPLLESRRRLLASAALLFTESVELGLAHLSAGIAERCATLAVWSQGVEYHRLALTLRRIADHVELLLERAGGADEHRLFDELSMACGLVAALQCAAHDAVPARLTGKSRTRYEGSGTVELLGLGAYAWRAASGYIGLTMVYWSPSEGSFLTCSDARPEIQRGFDPMTRYGASGPWAGLGAPAQATGRRVFLKTAQLNASGRVSGSPGTSATVQPLGADERFANLLPVSDDWPAMLGEIAKSRRSLLDEPQSASEWKILRPARFGPAQFDQARQVLKWPLFDKSGVRLDAELEFNDYTRHAITRIEALKSDELPADSVLAAHIRRGSSGPIAEPLSLIRSKTAKSGNPVDALYFDPGATQGFASRWLSKLSRPRSAGDSIGQPALGAVLVPDVLRNLRDWLQHQAERGVPDLGAAKLQTEYRQWAERCAGAGLAALQWLGMGQARPSQLLLKANYVYLQYLRLLGGSSEEPD
jgi:hypothetical protein